MADDQVKYSDLFDAGIIGEVQNLTNEITSLKNAIAAAKTEANGLRDNLRGAGTATREQQQQTAADAAAVEALNRQVKDLTDKLTKLEEKKKSLTGLTKDEESAVKALQQALKGEAKEQQAAAESLDSTNMSYNQMKASVAALQQALRGFATEEKKTSDEAKAMETAVENLRNAMKDIDNQTKAQANTEKEIARIYKESAKSRAEDEKSSSAMIKQAIKEREDAAKAEAAGREAYDKHISDMMLNSAKARVDASKEESKAAQDAHNAKQRELEEAFKAYDAEQKAEAKRAQEVQNTTDAIRRNYEAEKQRLKLTDEEYTAVSQLRVALQGTSQEQIAAVQAIDIQNKSYNELYQTYNALNDALKRMTVAERENSQAGKSMVNQAKEIRDTLNNLQQATGNYALNVGNYMSAFNGLQFQTQQLLREIPSAVNVKQFFLAISNNIPMFTDALTRYNKGIPEIRAKMAGVQAEIAKLNAELATMNTQTAAYEAKMVQINALKKQEVELQKASIGGWKAVLKTVGSWQTLVIVGLMLLQKLPDLIKKISERWKSAKDALTGYKNEMSATQAITRVTADAVKKVESETTELNIIVDRLSKINSGTEEWANGIAVVNRITGANLDATNATIESVREITRAYMEQAEQLAVNSLLTEKIAASNTNRKLRNQALMSDNLSDLMIILGIDENSEDYNRLASVFEGVKMRRQELTERIKKNFPYYGSLAVENTVTDAMKMSNDTADVLFRNIIYKHLEVMSDDAIRKLQSEYGIANPVGGNTKNGNTTKEPTEQDVNLRRWDAVKARIRVEKEGYDEERALAKANYKQSLEELKDWALREQAALKKNRDNGFITEEEYQQKLKNLNSNYFDLRKGLRDDYDKAIEASIQKEIDEEKKAAKEKIAQEEKDFKAHQEIDKRRFELTKHTAKEERKFVMQQQMEFLQWRIDNAKALGISPELLEVMKQEYAQMQEMFNKGIYSTGKKNTYSSGMEVIADVLGFDIDSNQMSALNSVFDQAKEALNSWMDARKAAADQAKELADDEVSAAENALNREIELRNQGYANNVALRERELADAKEKQRRAMEEQKKAAQEQILLDAALQTSSLITATANIIKQFPNPLVWGPMLATMWGSFAFAKIKAYQASTKSVQFREGGVMLLEGGSHESGHDVNLGIGPDGSNLRAEGGEYFAVINKRNSRKYGSEIPAVVNALNSGMFEDRYIKTSDAVGLLPRVIRADNGSEVDLSAVESGVGQLVKQGESRWTVEGEYRVERYKNRVRRVKIG